MKVYVVVTDYDWDGYGSPDEVFLNKEDAEKYVKEKKSIYPSEIFEMDVHEKAI